MSFTNMRKEVAWNGANMKEAGKDPMSFYETWFKPRATQLPVWMQLFDLNLGLRFSIPGISIILVHRAMWGRREVESEINLKVQVASQTYQRTNWLPGRPEVAPEVFSCVPRCREKLSWHFLPDGWLLPWWICESPIYWLTAKAAEGILKLEKLLMTPLTPILYTLTSHKLLLSPSMAKSSDEVRRLH